MYDDLGLFQRFWIFGRRGILEAIDEFNDLQYLASTKGSSSAFVGGRSCTCVSVFYCTSLEPFLFVCFVWRQFVADVKENSGVFPVTVKYRRPYTSTVITSWPRFDGAVVNSNRAHNYNRAVGRRAFR